MKPYQSTPAFRRCLIALLVACVAVLTAPSAGAASAMPTIAASANPYSVALNYTIRFYPRFLTYFQASLGSVNRLSGPDVMGPQYGIVVAPNDDTVYAEFFLDLAKGPQIFTIPSTTDTYSLLTLDVWGNVLKTTIEKQTPGTYALVQRGWRRNLPRGVKKVQVPYRFTTWIIRADKYTSNGQNVTDQALAFRAALRVASLRAYRQDPSSGPTQVLPVALFGARTKAIADEAIEFQPTSFFRLLQRAMHSPTTGPLAASDRQLSRTFDQAFKAANQAARTGNYKPLSRMIDAARTAHAMIVNRWQSHVDQNRWVYFGNIGEWGTAYLDRAALSEYIQYGNNTKAATYYDAFTDHFGVPLDGSVVPSYRLTFSKKQIPDADRFWSLTAYIPPGVTLFPNPANKYVVAGYTPGLQKNRDGSLTIYIQPNPPVGAPQANWLPVPDGPFSLLLRVYGPKGNTAIGRHYVPPPIAPFGIS